jgi:hypothetical protein
MPTAPAVKKELATNIMIIPAKAMGIAEIQISEVIEKGSVEPVGLERDR